MKKLILLCLFLVVGVAIAMAQNTVEVVSLKNGSVIRGTIVEQVPNQSLKIQTADGSIFVYQMDEVEKITKENTPPESKKSLREQLIEEHRSVQRSTTLSKGYLGAFELAYGFGLGDFKNFIDFSLLTTQGYQINPYLFAGVGAGVGIIGEIGSGEASYSIPVFADVRVTPLKNWFTPVLDVRVGTSFGDVEGLYFSPSVGVHGCVRDRSSVRIMLGYQLRQMDGVKDVSIDPWGNVNIETGKVNFNSIVARFVWEW